MLKCIFTIIAWFHPQNVWTYYEYETFDKEKGWHQSHAFYWGRQKNKLTNNERRRNCTKGEYVYVSSFPLRSEKRKSIW